MKHLISIILIVLFINQINAQGFEIRAELTGFNDGTKFYLEDADLETYIDSAKIKDDLLVFKGELKFYTPKLLFIYHFQDEHKKNDDEFVWCNLFIGNEKLKITGDKKDFPFFLEKTGSKYQDTYNKLNNKTRKLTDEWYSLYLRNNELRYNKNATDSVLLKTNKRKMDSLSEIIKPINDKLFLKNLNSYAAMNDLYGKRNIISKDSLQKLYNKVDNKYKNSAYGKRILTYLKVGDIMNINDNFLDFEGIDQNGNKRKLSDFVGDKYVLIDFMQAFCSACVEAEKELKYINEYYDEKVQIVSYSKDKMERDWKNGLKRDQPKWPSLWNGEGYFGKTTIKYGAQASPTFVLLSPNGKIIDKWIGFEKGIIKNKLIKHLD